MEDLYREHILDHYGNPRNQGRLDNPDITCEWDNPVCGDVAKLDLRLKDGRVSEARFDGSGCVISMASASMFTEKVLGMTVEELKGLQEEDIFKMLGITLGPARANCGLLPLRVLQAGLENLKT
jgi:nitrogen fixation NifU-like protein